MTDATDAVVDAVDATTGDTGVAALGVVAVLAVLADGSALGVDGRGAIYRGAIGPCNSEELVYTTVATADSYTRTVRAHGYLFSTETVTRNGFDADRRPHLAVDDPDPQHTLDRLWAEALLNPTPTPGHIYQFWHWAAGPIP